MSTITIIIASIGIIFATTSLICCAIATHHYHTGKYTTGQRWFTAAMLLSTSAAIITLSLT